MNFPDQRYSSARIKSHSHYYPLSLSGLGLESRTKQIGFDKATVGCQKCGCNIKNIIKMSTPKEGKRWLIWSLKQGAWWGPNESQYFTAKRLAGWYSFKEACAVLRRANQHGKDTPSAAMVEDPDHE